MHVIVLLIALLCLQASAETVTTVSPSCDEGSGSCLDLSSALEGLQSNTTLALLEGNHTVRNVSIVANVCDVKIIGNRLDPSLVRVNCNPFVGLVFANVTDLELSGFTLEECGLDGLLYSSISFPEFVPFVILTAYTSVGLLMGNCYNVVMENITMENNIGIAMVGINLIGNSRLSGLSILANGPGVCNLYAQFLGLSTGGGMYIAYEDYSNDESINETLAPELNILTIENSVFADNYICSVNLFNLQYNLLSRSISTIDLIDNSYSVNGAGALNIGMSQGKYRVNASIKSCTFRNNSGSYSSSAVQLAHFESTNNSHIFVENCYFYDNGGLLTDIFSTPDNFGAILAFFYTPIPLPILSMSDVAELLLHEPSTMQIRGCVFNNNQAINGGGLSVFSFGPAIGYIQDELHISDCNFSNNSAGFGSAIFITEISYSAFETGLRVFMHNINVVHNSRLSVFGNLQSETGAVDINYLDVLFSGENVFENNTLTALHAYSGIITLSGDAVFLRNSGIFGGALHLDAESYLILDRIANVTFVENVGFQAGGAIYVHFQTIRLTLYDCFLFFSSEINNFCDRNIRLFTRCATPSDGEFKVVFINNSAPLGSAVFGSALRDCPWIDGGEGNDFRRLQLLASFVSFEPPLNSGNVVNTVARSIRTNNNSIQSEPIVVMPGEEFTAQLGAFDTVRQPVPLTVFSQLSQTNGNSSDGAISIIGETDRYLLLGAPNLNDVPIRVFGNANSTFNVTIKSNEASAQLNLSVILTDCATGFRYDNTIQGCVCEIDTFIDNVECLNNGSVQYPVNAWIGQEEAKSYYIIHDCILDYCQPNVRLVNLDEPDQQCQNNRGGILCGECIQNYSRIFGSSPCRYCANNYGLFLIILFALLGILLVTIIAALNMTTADGYINGFIFYGNIVSLYAHDFLPLSSTVGGFVVVVLGFMSLDFGIETCFFRGMKELHRVALELIFPLYLGVILFVITLLARYGKKNILCKVNFTRVFATLLLLSYSSIVHTCIDILGYVVIDTPAGSLLRWHADPNVPFFQSFHTFLFAVSIVLLLILVPFPLILLFPSVTLRLPYFKKLKPLIDAFCGPLQNHGRFWVGFRLYMRLIIFGVSSFGPKGIRIVVIAVLLILTVFFQGVLKPFRGWMRNIVEYSLMLNLVILTVVAVYLQPQQLETNLKNMHITVGFICVFSAELALLIVYYIIVAIPASRRFCERMGRQLIRSSIEVAQKMKVVRRKKKSSTTVEIEMDSVNDFRRATRQMQRHNNDLSHTSVNIGHNAEEFEATDFVGFRESIFENENNDTQQ